MILMPVEGIFGVKSRCHEKYVTAVLKCIELGRDIDGNAKKRKETSKSTVKAICCFFD